MDAPIEKEGTGGMEEEERTVLNMPKAEGWCYAKSHKSPIGKRAISYNIGTRNGLAQMMQ